MGDLWVGENGIDGGDRLLLRSLELCGSVVY
jgi:hypothetical protein